ncbi:cytochrome b/b6 domain-containing protein [Acidovorax sp. sic0104]|uniref:cytochrome b/b6 domain-containing protein n=1 Tax=Acidovorax sp. sic0104 TaxID=2854784 RepID=UPI001C4564C0|nr:cytochrome b/b6 domain-containing protein [Acidovorax sp. sic0104]MBV7544227.1 cytochrome b/b6 domain-containing protein [Acidovorax sp. sic0104]
MTQPSPHPKQHTVRVWDLPVRLFHWALAACVIALVVTAKVGGNAMEWHFRLGYVVLALLVFRVLWGLVGGRWSRFATFIYSPARLVRYLRGAAHADDGVGHSPLGALSVFGLLAVLVAQVATGLLSDDEIAFAGPLTRFVSNAVVGQATSYHKEIGQYLVIGLVVLHLLAIVFYVAVRRQRLVGPMVHGDKVLPAPAAPSRDDWASRALALALLAGSAALAWWVSTLAGAPSF